LINRVGINHAKYPILLTVIFIKKIKMSNYVFGYNVLDLGYN